MNQRRRVGADSSVALKDLPDRARCRHLAQRALQDPPDLPRIPHRMRIAHLQHELLDTMLGARWGVVRLSRAILERLIILFRSFDPFVAHRWRDAETPAQLPDVGPFNPGQRYELSSIRHLGLFFKRHRAASFRRSLCASLGVHHVSGHLSTMSPVRTVPAGWLGGVLAAERANIATVAGRRAGGATPPSAYNPPPLRALFGSRLSLSTSAK